MEKRLLFQLQNSLFCIFNICWMIQKNRTFHILTHHVLSKWVPPPLREIYICKPKTELYTQRSTQRANKIGIHFSSFICQITYWNNRLLHFNGLSQRSLLTMLISWATFSLVRVFSLGDEKELI